MLLKTLKAGVNSLRRKSPRSALAGSELPYEIESRIGALHARAPLARHLDILLGDVVVGGEPFPALYRRCLEDTGTVLTPYNVFQRFLGRLNLVRYFVASLELPGARAEIGVYRGASALLLCRVARARLAGFDGSDVYLVDSFAGARGEGEEDLIAVRRAGGTVEREAFFSRPDAALDVQSVRRHFAEFPRASVVQGWVPEVLHSLTPERWAFVHLDVNLYRPSLAALEYFWPRLVAGGTIVCDDYGSPFTPGAKRAWHEFSDRHDVAFIVLGERQAVILKE
ncbi:MAG: class I SAM-dependent methyltransferase [Burkholderiales bacterium]|nr:class I SAM-dependent methyltransferase [Burkholderiales bacterium]